VQFVVDTVCSFALPSWWY